MKELDETRDKPLAELTRLDVAVVVRCKKLLWYPKKYQQMMLFPEPNQRVKADFFIELYPLVNDRNVRRTSWFDRNGFIDRMLEKYQNRESGIRSVTDFRKAKQHLTAAAKANQTAKAMQRWRDFLTSSEHDISYLEISTATIHRRAAHLSRGLDKLIDELHKIEAKEFYGEEELWKKLEHRTLMIAQAIIDAWVSDFAAYRHPPNVATVRRWLGYFGDHDEPLAESILNKVRLISEHSIQVGYRQSLESLDGWASNARERQGRWFFAGYGSAGESGQAMLRIFREANHLGSQKYQNLFVGATELPALKLSALDTVVFIDDFSGTGDQIIKSWPVTKELLGSEARTFLVLCAITQRALTRVSKETGLRVVSQVVLRDRHDVFHHSSTAFTHAERNRLLEYCRRADPRNPRGFGECGLLLVLGHRTPNNSLPVLHVNKRNWRGVFPRYLVNS
jgi:hypothetical protein